MVAFDGVHSVAFDASTVRQLPALPLHEFPDQFLCSGASSRPPPPPHCHCQIPSRVLGLIGPAHRMIFGMPADLVASRCPLNELLRATFAASIQAVLHPWHRPLHPPIPMDRWLSSYTAYLDVVVCLHYHIRAAYSMSAQTHQNYIIHPPNKSYQSC